VVIGCVGDRRGYPNSCPNNPACSEGSHSLVEALTDRQSAHCSGVLVPFSASALGVDISNWHGASSRICHEKSWVRYRRPMFVSDLRHFLDMPDDAPGPARRMADHLGGIVRAATAAESGEDWMSALSCRRRPNRKPCTGTISLFRTDVPPSIEWRCTGCGDMGVISGWQGSHFDLRERTSPGATTPRGKQIRLEATSDVVSVLREIEILDLACERAVFAARVESGRIFLKLNDEELEELAEHLAAEANHEPNRRRQKRLDAALMLLTAAQEDGRASSVRTLGDGYLRDGVRRVPTTALMGRWRIDDSDLWDRDALDLVGAAYVEFREDQTGSFRFIAVEGWLDYRPAEIDGRPGVEFTFEGTDEGDPVSGRGWAAQVECDELQLHIFFHMGDDSAFRARPFAAPSSE